MLVNNIYSNELKIHIMEFFLFMVQLTAKFTHEFTVQACFTPVICQRSFVVHEL